MASRLYALGRFSYRHRRLVALGWLAVLVLLGVGASTLKGAYSTQFSIPGTESQRAIDTLQTRFPQAGLDLATANVVVAAPKGERVDTPAHRAAVATVVADLADNEHVKAVTDPFTTPGSVSQDGRIAVARVTYDVSQAGIEKPYQKELLATAKAGEDAGLQVEYSGDAAQVQEPGGATELLGVLVAAIVLLVMFSSLSAAGLPLLTALGGVGIALAAITTLTGFVSLSSSTPGLGLMLGLAVGIDYALFIMSRYRDELIRGRSGEEAIARAVATAGSAVVFAGLTVVIALLGLVAVNIPFLTYLGFGAAGTVVIAVSIALTLLPAMLGFTGRRVLGRRKVRLSTDETDGPTMGHRWADFVARRPAKVLVVALAVMGVIAVPALSLKTGLPDEGTQSTSSTQRQAYDLQSEAFGPGSNGPLVVVVQTRAKGADALASAAGVQRALAKLAGVAAVGAPVPNPAGDTFLLPVVSKASPASEQTKRLVSRIRDLAEPLGARTGSTLAVSGRTASQIDVSDRLSAALPLYLVIVVGLAMLLLTVVFRSVVVPLKAVLGFLATMASTFGAIVAIAQWGWFGIVTPQPIISFLPVFMIGVIFGLAMDYQVFLVTRMREEHVHGAPAREAVVDGFRQSARVVTAAALIMISVFASFILSPDASLKSFGIAFSFGVAIDAFVVRMTIVPAVMLLLGERAWYLPRWLERVVPRVDIEGEGLRVLDEAEALTHTSEAVVD
jgi:RND superfamily putative drug exporter